MSPRLAFALDAAHEAGRATLGHFQVGTSVETKEDASPITVADRTAERMIRERIAREFPGEAILGEEEGGDMGALDRWVIDPIDGTKSFISGVPLYGTLLSYEEGGEPVVAACYFPALDEMLCAERGGGAFFNGRPCRVSSRPTLEGSVIACGGHASMLRQGRDCGFNIIAEKALATRTWGDAYGYALVATGRADAMVDPIVKRWDLSSVSLIVTEAGGRFTDFAGNTGIHDEAIASNGLIHDELLEAFRA